jgi:hypothetical protein
MLERYDNGVWTLLGVVVVVVVVASEVAVDLDVVVEHLRCLVPRRTHLFGLVIDRYSMPGQRRAIRTSQVADGVF